MNFSSSEFMISRQRNRQWVPLITQQFRLRHVYQIIGFNLYPSTSGSYYFTLHLTTMCAPFYTSEPINNPNPKWSDIDMKNIENTSASCIVLRIWQHDTDGADKIILTWGIHFSGLVYIGNKIADIQPRYFKSNSVIFYMLGGYYTSHKVIQSDLEKPVPFLSNLNLIDTLNDKAIYKRVAIKSVLSEVHTSYNIEKLRKIRALQVEIKRKSAEVQNIRDKINIKNGLNFNNEKEKSTRNLSPISPTRNIRYAPQLLTMNTLNRMLQEKPTGIQKQEMLKISKDIEVAKFKTKLLSQEKDKKTVTIRLLKNKQLTVVEENEERGSDLMENYHRLSREADKLKEYKRSLLQHREVFSHINSQLQLRRRQLMEELLFIYPIEKVNEQKYIINGIYFPSSDVLADCSDTGLSVALGYITHILIMCSTFLQVPLRYPLTHYGSRSLITDNVSPLIPDREREFPLFTRGKDKAQFTYAVYLLNKNLAQLRWLFYMNTNDLKPTLANLLHFLKGHKDVRSEPLSILNNKSDITNDQRGNKKLIPASPSNLGISEKYVSLHSFGSNSNISDPILDCIRHENQIQRSSSPTRKPVKKFSSKPCRNSECGKGLSEILAIPEAFLNKQISSDSLRKYITSEQYSADISCCGGSSSPAPISTESSSNNIIKITNGQEVKQKNNLESIEQGTDPLDSCINLSTVISKSIKIQSDSQLRKKSFDDSFEVKNKRISRSVGSYTDEDSGVTLRTMFELGSEPLLNISCDSRENYEKTESILAKSLEEGQNEFYEKWLETAPDLMCSNETLYTDEFLGTTPEQVLSENSPLMARTDALLKTKSFNLVKPKL